MHEQAGSSKVLHLHGELFKVRSIKDKNYILDWKTDLKSGDFDANGFQLRPHIVWFGEDVPVLEEALAITQQADCFVIVGTSMQVYPAAGLVEFTPPNCPIYYIDPNPATIRNLSNPLEIIPMNATEGVPFLKEILMKRE